MKKTTYRNLFLFFIIISMFSALLFLPFVRENLVILLGKVAGKNINKNAWAFKLLYLEKSFLSILLILDLFFVLGWKKNNFNNIVRNEIGSIKNSFVELKQSIKNKKLIKYSIILLVIYLISISSIIRGNINYLDDQARIFEGYRGWLNFSRYISEFLSIFIHGSINLADVSPLPQLLTVILVTITSLIIINVITGTNKVNIWHILAAIPIGLSPYFLECFSYKYDSLYMGISVLFAVLPFVFINSSLLSFGIITFLCNIVVCTSYQASLGFYPMLIIFLCFRDWKNKEFKPKFLLTAVVSYLASLLYFKLLLMIPMTDYISSSMFSISKLIPGFFSNIIKYMNLVFSDFNKLWLLLIVMLIIGFIINAFTNTKRNKIVSLLLSLVTIFLSSLLIFGIYPVLENPAFSPRAMYGVGGFVSFISLFILSSKENKGNLIFKISSFSLGWCFIAFAFIYGNGLTAQQKYRDFRAQQLISDLNDIEAFTTDSIKYIYIEGSIGIAPSLENNSHKSFPIMNRLNCMKLGGPWVWDNYTFFNYYDMKNVNEDITLAGKELPLIRDYMYETIYGDGTNYIVVLK